MTRANLKLFWAFWVVLGLVWLAFNLDIFLSTNYFALRSHMVQFTGFLAFSAMGVAMILSLRPRWPEKYMDGLDKMYRFHKWLGIGALGVAVFHFLWAKGTKWAVGAGWLVRPERGPRPEITDPVQSFLLGLRHTGEGVGEWAFYAVVALLVIALVKTVPYRLFRYSHRILPVAWLALVFHAVTCMDYDLWFTPVGWLVAVLALGGSYAAIVSLLGKIGASRRVEGEIKALSFYSGVKSLEAEIQLGKGWPGHKAGQFAFVTSNKLEGAHPYTIASDWKASESKLKFIAKELGDHTTGLVNRLSPGHSVTVEGPYGCFTFDDNRPRQIWVAGGIGITPFIARMEEMAANPDKAAGKAQGEIDLFHSTRDVDETGLQRLKDVAKAAGVNLHLNIDGRDGLLNGEHIRNTVPGWKQASVWFCGPIGFGKALRTDFAANGFMVDRLFHQELFDMR